MRLKGILFMMLAFLMIAFFCYAADKPEEKGIDGPEGYKVFKFGMTRQQAEEALKEQDIEVPKEGPFKTIDKMFDTETQLFVRFHEKTGDLYAIYVYVFDKTKYDDFKNYIIERYGEPKISSYIDKFRFERWDWKKREIQILESYGYFYVAFIDKSLR